MSKSGSSIGIGTVIFWAAIAFMWFSDDDEDKKEVESKDSTESAVVETEDGSRAKNKLIISWESVLAQAKEAYEEARSDETKQKMRDTINEAKEKLKELTGKEVEEDISIVTKEPEVKSYLKAPPKEGEPKPLDRDKVTPDDGMQKL